ncbi:MAG: hypothetical protein ACRDKW_03345 [Actinomycetota bacterium]
MQEPSGAHHSLVVAGRTVLRRLGRSKLDRHLRGMLMVRPARGRSLRYATVGNEALLVALGRDPHFCRDTAWGGVLHPGRASFRELHPGGLHIALEPHDRISAHLDRENPAVGRGEDGSCRYTHVLAARHIRRDVVPSLARRTGAGRHRLPVGGPLWQLRPTGPTSRTTGPPAPDTRPARPAPVPSGRPGSRRHPHRGPPRSDLAEDTSAMHQAAADPQAPGPNGKEDR